MSSIPLSAPLAAASAAAATGAALQAPVKLRSEVEISRPKDLDDIMGGSVSAAERAIFFLPLAARAMGLDLAPHVFRFWLFRRAKPPYAVTDVRTADFPSEASPPRGGERRVVEMKTRTVDLFVVAYERLQRDPNLPAAEARIRAELPRKLRERIATAEVRAKEETFEHAAQTHWSKLRASIATLRKGESRSFGRLDVLDLPELAVADATITGRDTLKSAAVEATERDAILGAHGVRAYVSVTVLRRESDYLFTFPDWGMRVFDLFEFSRPQELGLWHPKDGLLNLRGLRERNSGFVMGEIARLTNETMSDFAKGFAARYNQRVRDLAAEGKILPPLDCSDFAVVSRMRREGKPPHAPIEVPIG